MRPFEPEDHEHPEDHDAHVDHDDRSGHSDGDRILISRLLRAISHEGHCVPVYLSTHRASFLTPIKIDRFLLYQRVRSIESGRILAILVQFPISTTRERVALNLIARANHRLMRGHFTIDVNRGELAFRYEAVMSSDLPILRQFLDAQQQVNRLLSKHLPVFQTMLLSENGPRNPGNLLPPELFPPRDPDPEAQSRAIEDEEGPTPEQP